VILEPLADDWKVGSTPSPASSTTILFKLSMNNRSPKASGARRIVWLMRYLLDANAVIALLNDTTSKIAHARGANGPAT
jgi:hypothetical protein